VAGIKHSLGFHQLEIFITNLTSSSRSAIIY
jgi:hypothetical protein